MLEELDGYDWEQAFGFASPHRVEGATSSTEGFSREDVVEIHGIDEGWPPLLSRSWM